MRAASLLLPLLAACTAPAPRVSFVPDAGGLAVPAAGARIDFGRAPEGVIAALDRELGPGRELGVDGCPPVVARSRIWGDLALTFSAERFVGWRQGGGEAGLVCTQG